MIGHCPVVTPQPATVASMAGLLYFVWEREAIRIAKLNMLPRERWTSDAIFRQYKFTNIRRRDDRVSQWIIRHIIEPNAARPDLWFLLLQARMLNWPPTLEELIAQGALRGVDNFDAEEFSVAVEQRRARGLKTYTGAYMIYPTKQEPGAVKSLSVARHILRPALAQAPAVAAALRARSVEQFVAALAQTFGVSTFMAGQVAADLTYCEQLGSAVDLYSYAPIGPGSARGLNYLHGRRPFAVWGQGDFNRALLAVNAQIQRELLITDLTLHDVQNVMCEYSKYCRVALGEGTLKTTYQPEEEF